MARRSISGIANGLERSCMSFVTTKLVAVRPQFLKMAGQNQIPPEQATVIAWSDHQAMATWARVSRIAKAAVYDGNDGEQGLLSLSSVVEVNRAPRHFRHP
jgi:hypothetical protein